MAIKTPATILLWIDNPADTIIAADNQEIVSKFGFLGHRVVVGASRRCSMFCGLDTWPEAPPLVPPQHGYDSTSNNGGNETQLEMPDPSSRWRYLDTSVVVANAAGFDALMDEMPVPSLNRAKDVTDAAANLHSLYLDASDRERLSIGIDHSQAIVQQLSGLRQSELVEAGLRLDFTFRGENDTRIFNNASKETPCIFVGGGNTNVLNQIGNYVPLVWTPQQGCTSCSENRRCLPPLAGVHGAGAGNDTKDNAIHSDGSSRCSAGGGGGGDVRNNDNEEKVNDNRAIYPAVHISIIVEGTSPFLATFLNRWEQQEYPKSRQTVSIYVVRGASSETRYMPIVQSWIRKVNSSIDKYRDIAVVSSTPPPPAAAAGEARSTNNSVNEYEALRNSLLEAKTSGANFYFRLSSHSMLNSTLVLRKLIEANRAVVGPLLRRPGLLFSNFWASIKADAFAVCADEDRRCDAWRADGYCSPEHTHGDWMALNCPKACGVCAPTAARGSAVGYNRGFDYQPLAVETVDGYTGPDMHRRGVWSVPMLTKCVLLEARAYLKLLTALNENGEEAVVDDVDAEATVSAATTSSTKFSMPDDPTWAIDMQIAEWLKMSGEMIHMMNEERYGGWLVMPDAYNHTRLHPELFMLESNPDDWEAMYIDPEHRSQAHRLMDTVRPECWDIYNFPLFTGAFCDELVAESEAYGQWSGSNNTDQRLKGGYEPVPTQDIHFNQMGFGSTWKAVLKQFVGPVAQIQFTGYTFSGKETLDFIVRYSAVGQAALRPHFDASTFSVNVALNHIGTDFEGGGTHFTRQNCTVKSNQKGNALMHPGVLTHQHEGLQTTAGTRYIIVSFVDQR